jgi:hypothetical protein
MLPNEEPLLQYRNCLRQRVHDDDGNVHARHNEFRWLDGTGPGAECCSGTGSRAEHMILTCRNQFAVSLGQLLRDLAEPAP